MHNQVKSSLPVSLHAVEEFIEPCSLPGSGSFYTINRASLIRFCRDYGCSAKEAMCHLLQYDIWPLRYKMNRGIFTHQEQQRLLQSKVCIIGCGGLGGHVVHLLARLGVGFFLLCDFDCFDESNLNRQLFCTEETLGKSKAAVAQSFLQSSASHVESYTYTQAVDKNSVKEVLQGSELVFDCLDSLSTRRMVEEAALALNIPFVHGAVVGTEAFFGSSVGEEGGQGLLQFLYGEQVLSDAANAEKKKGIIALSPAVSAVFQCMLGVQLLLGKYSKENRLWYLDLESFALDLLRTTK